MHKCKTICTNIQRIVHNKVTMPWTLWCIEPSVHSTCRTVQLRAQKNSFVQKCSQWEIGAKLHKIWFLQNRTGQVQNCGASWGTLQCVAQEPYKASQIIKNVTPNMPQGTFQWKCQNWPLHIKLLLVVKTKAVPAAAPTWTSPFLQPADMQWHAGVFLARCRFKSNTKKGTFLMLFSRNKSWKAKFCHDFDPGGSRKKWGSRSSLALAISPPPHVSTGQHPTNSIV